MNVPKNKYHLFYRLDDIPPIGILIITSLQHMVAMFSGVIICPLIVASAIHLPEAETRSFLSLAIVAASIGTLMQAIRFGPIGSGFLSITGSSGTFIATSIAAGIDGGLSLICGMTAAASPVKILLSFPGGKLQDYFPEFLRGALIMLIGISILKISLIEITGPFSSISITEGLLKNIGIAVIVISVTLLCLKTTFYLRIAAILAGIIAGSVAAVATSSFELPDLSGVPLISLPDFFHTRLSFSWKHLLPFIIAYFITTFETLGDTYTLTEVSSPPEGGPNQGRIRGGILASGLASLFAGAIGTMATTTYSGNIAIIRITGVASRIAGIVTALILFPLAFFPVFSNFLAGLPGPVIGASMLVALSFMIGIGFEIVKRSATKREMTMTLFVSALALITVFFPGIVPETTPLRTMIINPVCSCTILLIFLHCLSKFFWKFHKKAT